MEPSLSQQITYRYMLEGVDKDWVYIGKNRNVRYGGLQPGSYVFKVSCSLNNKDWLSKVTEIEININPPFWKTWWFITLVGITLIGFLFLFVQQYNKRKYQKKLDSLKALQQLEEERQRISRDLHDNMGAYTSALLNNVQQLKNKTGENEDLIKMKSNADQILSSLRETIWVLNNKSVTVKEFSGSFKNYCFNILRNFDNIDFDTSENIENNKTLPAASTIHLTKILQEAFQNIIKHADATKVTYNITSIDKIEIRLIDNGTGFETNTIEKGNGINNMNWRAKEVGFSINLISTKEIGTTINLKEL